MQLPVVVLPIANYTRKPWFLRAPGKPCTLPSEDLRVRYLFAASTRAVAGVPANADADHHQQQSNHAKLAQHCKVRRLCGLCELIGKNYRQGDAWRHAEGRTDKIVTKRNARSTADDADRSKRRHGACCMVLLSGEDAVLDVESRVFLRDEVSKLGVAPLTSMFLYGPNQRPNTQNFRPAIYDSNGLAIHAGDGEYI